SARSKRLSLFRIVVSAFLRTVASAVAIWGSASTTSNSSIRISSARQEQATLIGLTSLWTNGRTAVEPELNRRRAVFVLGKIDEILSWERTKEQEKDVRFVELGEYLCEVRSKQYWRCGRVKACDD